MKDVHEVIRQKERDIQRIKNEIAALQFVVPLLEDDEDVLEHEPSKPRTSWFSLSAQLHPVKHES